MITARGLAQALGCHFATVRRAIQRGRLRAVRLRRFWVIYEDDAYVRFVRRLQRLKAYREAQRARLQARWASGQQNKKPPKGQWVRLMICERDRQALALQREGENEWGKFKVYRCGACGFTIIVR